MKREATVMVVCAIALLAIEAWMPYGPLSRFLVFVLCAAVLLAFLSAFNKA
jgi:hypothetical protein